MNTRLHHTIALVFILGIFSSFPLDAKSAEAPSVSLPVTDPGTADTLRLSSSSVPQGADMVLPIHFFCDEELGGIQVALSFDASELVCDSISFVWSTVGIGTPLATIDNTAGTLRAGVLFVGTKVIPPQTGLLSLAYFSQKGATHAATYLFDSTAIQIDSATFIRTVFSTTNPATSIFPEFVSAEIDILEFIAGDANNDNKVGIADVTFLVNRIFLNGPAPVHPQAADCDASCTVSIGDVTFLVAHIFTNGAYPRLGCAQ